MDNEIKTDILHFSSEERALATRQLLDDAGIVNATSEEILWAEGQMNDSFDMFLIALKKANRLKKAEAETE